MDEQAKTCDMKSWKVVVRTHSCKPGAWTSNGLRYKEHADASRAGADLADRWAAVIAWDVHPSTDKPNR